MLVEEEVVVKVDERLLLLLMKLFAVFLPLLLMLLLFPLLPLIAPQIVSNVIQ